jgi:hypothetical protein
VATHPPTATEQSASQAVIKMPHIFYFLMWTDTTAWGKYRFCKLSFPAAEVTPKKRGNRDEASVGTALWVFNWFLCVCILSVYDIYAVGYGKFKGSRSVPLSSLLTHLLIVHRFCLLLVIQEILFGEKHSPSTPSSELSTF